jgi:predicted ABC-type ATPase
VTVDEAPSLIALAGPNGAGKSTAGPILLQETLGVTEFVNADLIAQGLSPFAPETAAVAAGRIMLARMRDLAHRRATFAFETTLAGRAYVPWIERLIGSGYQFQIIFLWLPSPEFAVARVANRVHLGGHSVPEAAVRRRYDRGLRNFFSLYHPLASKWRMHGNAGVGDPQLIANGRGETAERISEPDTWSMISRRYADGT